MKKGIIISVVAAILCIGIIAGAIIFTSPEYALMQISKDVKESGLEGLTPHLTEKAQKTVNSINIVTDNKLVGSILAALGQSEYAGVLKNNLDKVEWELEEILKGKRKATVILSFNYKNLLIGTVEINMEREKGWKISGIEMPKFEKVIL